LCKLFLAHSGIQCEHLWLLQGKKFDVTMWNERWRHREELGKSRRCGEEEGELLTFDGRMSQGLSQGSVDPGLFLQDLSQQSMQPSSRNHLSNKKIPLKELLRLSNQLGYAIHGVHNIPKQRMFLGAVVKLTEVANGNELNDEESLCKAINQHLNMFSSTSHLS